MKLRDKGVKRQQAFNDKAKAIVEKLGGIAEEKNPYKLKLNTRAGILNVSLHEPEKSALFSIFCCFDDEKKAAEILPNDTTLNRHSGKWNFHLSDDKELLQIFKAELKYLVNGSTKTN